MTTYVDSDGHPVATVNPGTEPVEHHNAEQALKNLYQLAYDVGGAVREEDNQHAPIEEGGRYRFTLRNHLGVPVEVEMPGIPLAQVRYMQEPGQDIWDFPRLYVDGSSWVWRFAINVILDTTEPMQS